MINVIQAGRAIAAIAVCAFHLSIGFGDERYAGHQVFRGLTSRGELGVDFFFVLSGFIMMLVHQRDIGQPNAWVQYALKRFIRLYPIYWLYTATFCGLVLLGFGQVTKLPVDVEHWISAVLLVRIDLGIPPLAPAWTLFHEVFFYVVFGVLVFNRRWGAALMTLWVAACLFNYQYASIDQRTALNTYLSAYNIEFVTGMLACVSYGWVLKSPRRPAKMIGIISAMCGVIACFIVIHFETVEVSSRTRVVYALSFGLTLFGATLLEFAARPFRWPILTLLGDASYSIYLTHEAFIGVFSKIVFKSGFYGSFGEVVSYWFILVLAVAAGVAAFAVVERPVLRLARRNINAGR